MRGRFAPSPTGDLHLGGARTALCAWLSARKSASSFVLRVEDLDRPRCSARAETSILSDIRFLGLDWDEGPDVGGPHAPYRQSERSARYAEVRDRLLDEGRAFYCFCSRAEVARAAGAPHGPGDDGPRYPGTCRTLSPAEIAERMKTRSPSVRLRVDPERIDWIDEAHGAQHEDVSQTVGDFVIARSDGVFAYQLAVVVDDADMRIEEVVRGDDLSSSTARQILLYRALGRGAPKFAHVPLVLGADGTRLSKRHGDIGLTALRARGRSAPSIIGALAASLGLCEPGDQIHPRDLLSRFSFSSLPRAATVLDPACVQGNCVAPMAPSGVSVKPLDAGAVQVTFTGSAGAIYQLQSSADFHGPWSDLAAVTADDKGVCVYVDADAANHPTRYYRALIPVAP